MARWMNLCLLSISVVIMLSGVSPHPDGAPEEACSDMMPKHTLIEPSVLPPVFTISVSSDTFRLGVSLKG